MICSLWVIGHLSRIYTAFRSIHMSTSGSSLWQGNNLYFTCCSITKSCPTLCNPMGFSMPGFPVYHQLLELTQTHVHWVSDAIQPSHPLLSPSPPAFNLSQHQGLISMSQLFASGSQSTEASASVLPKTIQDWFPLGWTGWIALHSMGLSRVFSNTTAQKHQFFGTQPSLWSNSYIHTWLLEKNNIALTSRTFISKVMSLLSFGIFPHGKNVVMTFFCCSVAKSWPALCDPMDSSTPGSSLLHYLPEFAQIHVNWVDNANHGLSRICKSK